MRRRTAPKPTICKRQTPAPADTGADLGLSVQGRIRALILILHGENVVLDRDLAELHGVGTRALLRAERRNRARFPDDFAFHLTSDEYRDLRSQVVISSWGGRRTLPFAFKEQGVAMLSSVLRSGRAVNVNVEIMRAFVRLGRLLASHADLARKLAEFERKYDAQFKVVFDAVRALMESHPAPVVPNPLIGFDPGAEK